MRKDSSALAVTWMELEVLPQFSPLKFSELSQKKKILGYLSHVWNINKQLKEEDNS